MNAKEKIKTTGKLREVLADTISKLISGEIEIEQANAMHRLSKNITDSLYSETKIKMFAQEIGGSSHEMGNLPLGEKVKDSK